MSALARNAVTSGVIDYRTYLSLFWQAHLSPRQANAPTVVSTFAGAGGSSLGYSAAGYKELLAVEWDGNAVETFKLNFPDVPVHQGDITQLSVEEVLEKTGLEPGQLSLFDSSFPCQSFSMAGRRLWNDPRSALWRESMRLLRGLQPQAFVMENVAGLARGRMRVILQEIIHELRASGYQVRVKLLNAMYFGVAQSRWRLILLGVRNDLNRKSTHPEAQTRPFTIAQAIGDLGNDQIHAIGHIWVNESPEGRNTRTWHLANRARQGKVYAGQQRRQKWHRPADTLTTGGLLQQPYLRGLPCHPLYTRTFSPREMARLSSFPDEFQFAREPFEWIRPIGNCVPPLFMKAIAEHLRMNVLDKIGQTGTG